MRFASWESDGTVRSGVVTDAGLHAFPSGAAMLDVLVEMSVEGIGSLANRVVAGQWLPTARPARPRPRSRARR